MKCPECGHAINDHTQHFDEGGCYADGYGCMCMLSSIEIMRNAWKTEAMAARELLETFAKNIYKIDAYAKCEYCSAEAWSGHEETCEYLLRLDTYRAARVEEEKE